MNAEKLKKLQAQVRIGGKGTPRRKKKIVHQTAGTDDKKLQGVLKKINVNAIPGIEEANMIKNDGTVIHFNNPKVQASLPTNTFAITGHGETKRIGDLLPGILTQLGSTNLSSWGRLASLAAKTKLAPTDDDDVPDLVENFEEVAKKDEATENATSTVSDGAVNDTTKNDNDDDTKAKENVNVTETNVVKTDDIENVSKKVEEVTVS